MLLSSHVVFPTYSIFQRRYSTVDPYLQDQSISVSTPNQECLFVKCPSESSIFLVMASENRDLNRLEMLD